MTARTVIVGMKKKCKYVAYLDVYVNRGMT